MKKFYIFFFSLTVINITYQQVNELSDNTILTDNANKTNTAATTMCIISFISETTGAGLILAGYDVVNRSPAGAAKRVAMKKDTFTFDLPHKRIVFADQQKKSPVIAGLFYQNLNDSLLD